MTISLRIQFLFRDLSSFDRLLQSSACWFTPQDKTALPHCVIKVSFFARHFIISALHRISCLPPLVAQFLCSHSVAQVAHLLSALHVACPARPHLFSLSWPRFPSKGLSWGRPKFLPCLLAPKMCIAYTPAFLVKSNLTFITTTASSDSCAWFLFRGWNSQWQLVQGNHAHLVFHVIAFRLSFLNAVSDPFFACLLGTLNGTVSSENLRQLEYFRVACIPGFS